MTFLERIGLKSRQCPPGLTLREEIEWHWQEEDRYWRIASRARTATTVMFALSAALLIFAAVAS